MSRKQWGNKIWRPTKKLKIECWGEDTSYGFRHLGIITSGGLCLAEAKATYYNRTWESFTFETVIKKLYDQISGMEYLSKYQKNKVKKIIENGGREEAKEFDSQMKSVAGIAMLGDIFGKTKEEQNSWKARMLKAGMPGLEMPSDWETLSEDEKEARLNAVINQMKGKNENL